MTSHETEDEEKKRVRYLKIRLPSRAAAAKEEATRRRRRQTKAPRVSSRPRAHADRREEAAAAATCRSRWRPCVAVPPTPFAAVPPTPFAGRCAAASREREGERGRGKQRRRRGLLIYLRT